jgi:predicted transcriptional regulator
MSKEIEKIKGDILHKFIELNAGVNHTIPPRWFNLHYYPLLNSTEKNVFEKAIEELIEEGIVASVQDSIMLTEKGVDKIYPDKKGTPKEKVKKDILKKFKDINAKENHVIPGRWLSLLYFPNLNPKEKRVFDEAIDELIKEEIVIPAHNTIKLTKKGVYTIY